MFEMFEEFFTFSLRDFDVRCRMRTSQLLFHELHIIGCTVVADATAAGILWGGSFGATQGILRRRGGGVGGGGSRRRHW